MEIWGILRVLVSCKITRGIKLVVGRVTERVLGAWGWFGEFGGSEGGVKGGLFDSYRALFAPLEVLYCARFGSKHHIMVQLTNGDKVVITDPFLDLLGPPRSSQRGAS